MSDVKLDDNRNVTVFTCSCCGHKNVVHDYIKDIAELVYLIRELKQGSCWCEAGIDDPMLKGEHSDACLTIQDIMKGYIHDENPKTINGEPYKIIPLTCKDHNISKDEPIIKFGSFSKYKKGL